MRERLFRLYAELQQKGLKLTPARKIMLEIFIDSSEKLLNASDLYALVRAKNNRINFSTVYRNLEVLVDSGFVEKITFAGAANYKLLDHETHRHHLICTVCNKTEPLPYCPVGELVASVKKTSGFHATEHRVEIFGFCAECSGNANSKEEN